MASLAEALDSIRKRVVEGNNVLEVGFMAEATYPDGTSVAEVAAKNEFGDPKENRVARPFFRRMIAEKKKNWATDLNSLLAHGNSIDEALDLLGKRMGEDLQMSIRNFTDPPLRPSTIAKKGFDKPLIDTANMLMSVSHRVSKEP